MMKKLVFLLSFFLFTVIGLQAQTESAKVFDLDTITDAENDTLTWTLDIKDHGVIEYLIEFDSLSGTPAGTISYQYSLDEDATKYFTVSTDTIADQDITVTQHKVTNYAGRKARIVIDGSGTQSTAYRAIIGFKRYSDW